MQNLTTFFHSATLVDFYQILSVIGFWGSITFCIAIAGLIVHMDRKYSAKKKQLQKMIGASGMEDVRWLLKDRLKKHGIDLDEGVHEKH